MKKRSMKIDAPSVSFRFGYCGWNGRVSAVTNGIGPVTAYAYDALGRRVSTTTREGTIRHVYDGVQCIADLDGNGEVVASYTWGAGIDNLLAIRTGGVTYYPLTDVQGTVWGYADSSNSIVARFEYDAWGNILSATSSVPELARNRYRFQCREWSAATGLVNFRARWYDAETGRWLSKDPIGLSGGLNLYAFCGNDPVNNHDPFGCKEKGKCGNDDADSPRSYWDKYSDIINAVTINPTDFLPKVAPLVPIGPMPKSWAPATGGRPPALGSKNPWTSIPRGAGLDNGPLRPILRSAAFRFASGAVGAVVLGVGVWNAGAFAGAFIGALYSD